MTKNQKIAQESLERRIENYKRQKVKDIQALEQATNKLIDQIHLVELVRLIDTVRMNEYLSQVEKRYMEILQTESFKEYREQIVNFNDYESFRDKLFRYAKQEEKNVSRSRSEWEEMLKESYSAGLGSNEREPAYISVDQEREDDQEIQKEFHG